MSYKIGDIPDKKGKVGETLEIKVPLIDFDDGEILADLNCKTLDSSFFKIDADLITVVIPDNYEDDEIVLNLTINNLPKVKKVIYIDVLRDENQNTDSEEDLSDEDEENESDLLQETEKIIDKKDFLEDKSQSKTDFDENKGNLNRNEILKLKIKELKVSAGDQKIYFKDVFENFTPREMFWRIKGDDSILVKEGIDNVFLKMDKSVNGFFDLEYISEKSSDSGTVILRVKGVKEPELNEKNPPQKNEETEFIPKDSFKEKIKDETNFQNSSQKEAFIKSNEKLEKEDSFNKKKIKDETNSQNSSQKGALNSENHKEKNDFNYKDNAKKLEDEALLKKQKGSILNGDYYLEVLVKGRVQSSLKRQIIKGKSIIVGKFSSRYPTPDIDLKSYLSDIVANNCSKQQLKIFWTSDSYIVVLNIGNNDVLVDGETLMPQKERYLNENSLITIASEVKISLRGGIL